DTGDTPNLTYPCTGCPAGTVTDRAGNALKKITGSSIVAVDRAPPILVSAYGLDPPRTNGVRDAGSYLHIFFSENVMGSGSYTDPDLGFVAGGVQIGDICYED